MRFTELFEKFPALKQVMRGDRKRMDTHTKPGFNLISVGALNFGPDPRLVPGGAPKPPKPQPPNNYNPRNMRSNAAIILNRQSKNGNQF